MRANEFTFKKTKRVKTVTEHQGISLDLTVTEAADLAELVGNCATGDKDCGNFMWDTYQALRAFVEKNAGQARIKLAIPVIKTKDQKASLRTAKGTPDYLEVPF